MKKITTKIDYSIKSEYIKKLNIYLKNIEKDKNDGNNNKYPNK
jgi:hypothetical protein